MKLFNQIESGRVIGPRRILLYATRGIGASTFAAGFPAPIFVPADDSMSHIDCARFPVARRFGQVMLALHELYVEPHDYRTVVIDPLDTLELLIWDEFCRERGIEHIEDVPLAKGYTLALSVWRQLLWRLDLLRSDIGLNILLVARAQTERPVAASEGVASFAPERSGPALHRQASALVQSWCDEVLFATYAERSHGMSGSKPKAGSKSNGAGAHPPSGPWLGDQRLIYALPSRTHAAKNHLNLPPQLPMQASSLLSYLSPPTSPPQSGQAGLN